ncbi:MAG TPA: glycosyltransferase family 39 protein, partial [Thermoanaerobaculia bacterium]|nr:glycosyltransferase family 39 protein [Thermoanaerobaculia bacterium]
MTEPARGEPDPSGRSGRNAADAARRAAGLLLLIGVGWRFLRFAQDFALSTDESYVALNLMDADWPEVFRPARAQAAPALFLVLEKAALALFGPSEFGLRLLPLAAGVLGLVLFRRLANRALPPLAAALATGILAVSYFPLRFSAEVKPYSLDLLAAVVLLDLGLRVREDPDRLRPLGFLVVLAPLLVVLSYPSCLVVASVSAVLLPVVLRHRDARGKVLFVAYNLAALAAFLVSYLRVGVGQLQGEGGFLREFWEWHGAFPPAAPWALLVWLFRLATGLVFAYPLGDVTGASALTFLIAALGAVSLSKSGRPGVLWLCLLPFAATFAVAAAR